MSKPIVPHYTRVHSPLPTADFTFFLSLPRPLKMQQVTLEPFVLPFEAYYAGNFPLLQRSQITYGNRFIEIYWSSDHACPIVFDAQQYFLVCSQTRHANEINIRDVLCALNLSNEPVTLARADSPFGVTHHLENILDTPIHNIDICQLDVGSVPPEPPLHVIYRSSNFAESIPPLTTGDDDTTFAVA